MLIRNHYYKYIYLHACLRFRGSIPSIYFVFIFFSDPLISLAFWLSSLLLYHHQKLKEVIIWRKCFFFYLFLLNKIVLLSLSLSLSLCLVTREWILNYVELRFLFFLFHFEFCILWDSGNYRSIFLQEL